MKAKFLAATALGMALAAQPAATQIFKQASVIKNDMSADDKALVDKWNNYQNCVSRAQRDIQAQGDALHNEVHDVYERAQRNPRLTLKNELAKSALLRDRAAIDLTGLPAPLPSLNSREGQIIAAKLYLALTKNDITAWEKCGDHLGVSGNHDAQRTDHSRLTQITFREVDLKNQICGLQARGALVSNICPTSRSKGP